MIRPRRAVRWHSFVFLGVLALMTLWMTRSVRLAEIPSGSMEPTLQPGDLVLMRIDAYRHSLPQRGDIVIFRDRKTGELLAKRVIGLPGEEVGVAGDAVWIDHKRLEEPYTKGAQTWRSGFLVKLGDDQIWVMGDNRERSFDSRDFGPISSKQLVGRGAGIIWPVNRRQRFPHGTDDTKT
ncbi:MAG: signal peptidase I [Armatimonadia bacterium]